MAKSGNNVFRYETGPLVKSYVYSEFELVLPYFRVFIKINIKYRHTDTILLVQSFLSSRILAELSPFEKVGAPTKLGLLFSFNNINSQYFFKITSYDK